MADSCRNLTYVRGSVGPATSTLMFVAGVVGNGLALGILSARCCHSCRNLTYVRGSVGPATSTLMFVAGVQYCPGSWCFIRLRSAEPSGCAFSLAYASLVALLVSAIVLCNGSVALSLCRMYRQQKRHQGSVVPSSGSREDEVDHLILLALMTVIMTVCSLPLTIRGFTQAIAPDSSEMGDLLAFRFNAFNPILDPWVFILFRKAVFQRLRHWFCCLCPGPARGDSVTLRSQPASRRRDPQAPAALEGKEGNWVPLSAWSKGQVAPFPPANTVGTATRPKAEASVACSLC
ncbi:prostacyclin receptor [Fukomys damarensis]|uniref:prostacyclin receptor n=1 Tax=Fukomys damarensis TaxID=885580 RepID=UPI0005401865|nr:prostacyclin receptor [Fukomys damarensis]